MATVGQEGANGWGLTRRQRFPAELAADYALVDERRVEHFLSFAREYASLLNFYDLSGKVGGDWVPFFDSDNCFLLAEICIAGDTPTAPTDPQQSSDAERATDVLEDIYTRLQRIEDWRRRAAATDLQHMERKSSQLTPTLQALIVDLEGTLREHILSVRSWRRIWRNIERQHRESGGVGTSYLPPGNDDDDEEAAPDEQGDNLTKLLSAQNTVRFADRKLGALAHGFLRDSLVQQSDHPPHIALYLAFLQLMDVLRVDVNTYTERHLDFYYRRILRLSERPGTPDRVCVALELAPAFPSYTVPAGTPLAAGKDGSGKDIVFLTDKDLDVNRARVASLRTLYLAREKSDPPKPLEWVQQAWAAPAANLQDGWGKPLKHKELGWPAMGNFMGRSVGPNHFATVGFLIVSPVLLLQEGERKVSLRFAFDNADAAQLLDALTSRATTAANQAEPLEQILAQGWLAYVSTAKGWLKIAAPQFTYDDTGVGGVAIEVRFAFGGGDAALAPNQQLPELTDCAWPALKLVLNPDAAVCQYSTFAQMKVRQIDINVSAAGIGNLALQGALGPIASGKPFAAFGAMPAVGSYLQIAHAEMGKQGVQSANISLLWQQLPDSLSTYYNGYGKLNFDASQFKVDLAMSAGGVWRPVATQPLFGDGLKSSTLRCVPPLAGDGPPANGAAPGSVRIELASPAYAFGHADYQNLFADQAMRNVAAIVQAKGSAPAQLSDTIKPPLTPTVKSVSLAYTAADSIDLSVAPGPGQIAKFRHVHPFGCCAPPAGALNDDGKNDYAPTILPVDDGKDGYLYIGIADLDFDAGRTVVLHFQFCEQAAAEFRLEQDVSSTAIEDATISWHYLANDVWQPFDKQAVVSYTNEFQCSGIVRIAIPVDITAENMLMPAGMVWIRACASGAACDGLLVDVLAQAVNATRAGAPTELPFLPPGGIAGFQKKTAQIKSVSQPYPSSRGSAAESTQQYRTRVSERLKHKQRASQPGDYERLALAEYPLLWQAKCVTANSSRDYGLAGRVAAGEVMLVVVQEPHQNGAMPPPLSKQMLAQIAAFLQQHASPSVRAIVVRNPVYRSVQVAIDVRFRSDRENGDFVPRLNAAISNCIAPWLADGSLAETLGGGTIYLEELKRQIADLPYVQEILSKQVQVFYTDGAGVPDTALNFVNGAATPDTPWTVFVPYTRHSINASETPVPPQPAPRGIGAMTIGRSFVVGKAPASLLARPAQSARAATRYLLTIPRP